MPNKVVITGFKDSLTNENIIIKPELIPPINHEKPIMKDVETNTNDESSSSSSSNTSRTDLWNSKRFACFIKFFKHISYRPLELKAIRLLHQNLKKQIVMPYNERKIKEEGYKLNELTAYRYDLIDVDDNANKDELAKKLDNIITHRFWSYTNSRWYIL
nr:hypothetical protein [Mycoplasmopsis bovis]